MNLVQSETGEPGCGGVNCAEPSCAGAAEGSFPGGAGAHRSGQWSNPKESTSVLTEEEREQAPAYLVICWDDPVNLMNYVTYVFQKVFGWDRKKAEHHMLEVHNNGRSVLVRDTLERAEHYVHLLQQYKLQATLEKE